MSVRNFVGMLCLLLLAITSSGCVGLTVGKTALPLQITTSSVPVATVGINYVANLAAANGVAPHSWSVAGGSLPPGLNLQASGQISGMPTQAGTFSFAVQVKDSASHAASANFSANVAPAGTPVVAGVSPSSGSAAGGTTVSITGANFQAGAIVSFGGTAPSSVIVNSATQITVITAAHLAGSVSVTVQDPNGESSTLANAFTYAAAAPTISSVSPNSGPTSGGTHVLITGTNFLAGTLVSFGSTPATGVSVNSATQISATTPANAAGSVNVTAQVPGNATVSAPNAFTYNVPTPTVSSISPSSGPTSGGTQVLITGTNFLAGALVLFGGTPATGISVKSATQITAITPANAAGTVTVTVSVPGDAPANAPNAFTYAVPGPKPTITSLSPTSGAAGTSVTVNGSNFVSGTTVAFGTTTATTKFVSATQLTAIVPNLSAGVVSVTVTNPDGSSGSLTNGFTVAAPPQGALLTGCTVSAANAPSCTIPSGWRLADTQAFEKGSLNSGEAFFNPANSIECSFAHSGSCALVRFNNSGDQATGIIISGGSINARETYASWWEYLDAQTLLSLQLITSRRTIYDGSGNTLTDLFVNWEDGAAGCFENCTHMQTSMYVEGRGALPNGSSYGGGNYPILAGQWVQYEFHLKTNDPGQSNGVMEWWRNGTLIQSISATSGHCSWGNCGNLNGTQDMAPAQLEIGGFNETLTYYQDAAHTTCSPAQFLGPFAVSLSNWSSPPCPLQYPPNGKVPTFNRYIDDIIVLAR